MTPLEAVITICAIGLSVIAISSNYILFYEYINCGLVGFLVSQIFRDLKKKINKYTKTFSEKIFTLTTDTQNRIGTTIVLFAVIFGTIFFTFFWSKQCLFEAKEATHRCFQWIEQRLSNSSKMPSASSSTASSNSDNNMILHFIKEKKDVFAKYIEMIEDHTVINTTNTLEDGQILFVEGSAFSMEYFQKVTALLMNATLRQDFLDKLESGIDIDSYVQQFSEVAISSIVNVILIAGDFILNLSVFLISLYYNLLSEKDLIQNLCIDILPTDRALTNEISRSISDTMEDIIMLPIRIGVFRIFSTWILFHLLQLPFPYFATLLMLFSALIPVLTPLLTMLPWIIGMIYIKQWMNVIALLIFTLYLLPAYDASEYKKGLRMHPYIISLSILTGFHEFGFPGILYGPLILCFGKLFYITIKKLKLSKIDSLVGNSFFGDSDEVISEAIKHYNSRQSLFNLRKREATSPATISPRISSYGEFQNERSSDIDDAEFHENISLSKKKRASSPKLIAVKEIDDAANNNDLLQNTDSTKGIGSKIKHIDGNKSLPFVTTTRRNTLLGVNKNKNNSNSYANLREMKNKNQISPFVVANNNDIKRNSADNFLKKKLVSTAQNQLQGLIRANKSKRKLNLSITTRNKNGKFFNKTSSGTWK
jgi:predicted PurR-regulated permease PerM